MIKKALEYIVGLKAPHIEEIDGVIWTDKQLYKVADEPLAEEIYMQTLSSLVEYIRAFGDEMSKRMIVHVRTPLLVSLYSPLDKERRREYIASARGVVPEFRFNHFMPHEEFLIGIQSKFMPTEDLALVMRFAGTVESGSVAQYGDDGVSQKATIKTGLTSKNDALVPNPVILRPYRTFIEVEQPVSPFIFRMKQDSRGEVMCALFEADGDAWRIEASRNVAELLREELTNYSEYVVIS